LPSQESQDSSSQFLLNPIVFRLLKHLSDSILPVIKPPRGKNVVADLSFVTGRIKLSVRINGMPLIIRSEKTLAN